VLKILFSGLIYQCYFFVLISFFFSVLIFVAVFLFSISSDGNNDDFMCKLNSTLSNFCVKTSHCIACYFIFVYSGF
jgi:predicted RND superfamily exporter protein